MARARRGPDAAALDEAELVVDAIFGAGLSRASPGAAAEILAAAASKRLTLIAVDVPSGRMGTPAPAWAQCLAHSPRRASKKKPGHLLQPGRSLCGEPVLADIGPPASVFEQVMPDTFENDPRLWTNALPVLRPEGNKYPRGHALVWGGWPRRRGRHEGD